MSSSRSEQPADRASLIIGLTGGIGTGKSTAAKYLASRGMVHIDADAISRKITEKAPDEENPVLEEIGRAFGTDTPSVLRPDGSLDRRAMAKIVFTDPGKKKTLEDILFRHIIAEIRRQIASAEEAADEKNRNDASDSPVLILLDVPLLFESGLDSLCDKVIVLTADRDVRIRRVTERDGCSAEDVEARIRNQMSDEEKIARADFPVDNSETREHMQRQLDEVIAQLI